MGDVQGQSITTDASRRRLDVPARLELFRDVCAAVAHAHRSLVIHRDLKPANVMVQEDDRGHAAVKLLDFGIARIIAEELGDDADDNEHGLAGDAVTRPLPAADRSEEHTSELQSLMRNQYAVFCLKKKKGTT